MTNENVSPQTDAYSDVANNGKMIYNFGDLKCRLFYYFFRLQGADNPVLPALQVRPCSDRQSRRRAFRFPPLDLKCKDGP